MEAHQRALDSLLALLASCCPKKVTQELDEDMILFLDLQDTFEYNGEFVTALFVLSLNYHNSYHTAAQLAYKD